uniref:Uncharacterized protein n=1 Tax=Ditylenchus dipsaci TaxID=166011 RepID=A0A915CKP6_9BILA
MNNVNPFPSPFETDFEPDDVSDNAAPTVRSAGSTYPFFVDVQKRVCLRKCVSSRKFLISLVIFSSSLPLSHYAAFLNQHISWRDKCERKCAGSFDVPPLLLISLDGFRADYLDRELTPAVSRILNCGSQSEYLMPSYPSKTFPNHFTIVTGLYPESHGIVDNYFMDLTMEEQYFSRKSKDVNAAEDNRAEVNIRVSGACSPIYLSRRGIELSKYRPLIRFNPEKIQLIPKNPVIPGSEVEMRIGGTPDPNNPTLPCTKKIDDKVNQCPCAKSEGSCVFCDFCRQMKSQTARVSLSESSKSSPSANSEQSLEELCKCEVMQPGLYDIETEMCTPELEDAKQFIPPEIQNNILEKTPISMFITVYLMDMQPNANESYLSAFGKAILQRRMAQSTVACFLMGLDVTLGGIGGSGSSSVAAGQ